jgi:hypothetical protein
VIDSDDPELIRTLVHARADGMPNPRVARRYRNLLVDNGFVNVTVEVHTIVWTDAGCLPMLANIGEGTWLDDQAGHATTGCSSPSRCFSPPGLAPTEYRLAVGGDRRKCRGRSQLLGLAFDTQARRRRIPPGPGPDTERGAEKCGGRPRGRVGEHRAGPRRADRVLGHVPGGLASAQVPNECHASTEVTA